MPGTRRPRLHAGLALVVALAALGASAQTISPARVRQAIDRIGPALCPIRYSVEVRNPRSGAVSKRENQALGVIVSEDGLVIAHGHMDRENFEPFNIRVTVGRGEDEKVYTATLLDKPDDVNLAFLRLEPDEPRTFPFVTFDASPRIDVGEQVLVIGLLSDALDYTPAAQVRMVNASLAEPRTTYTLDNGVPFGFVTGPVVDAAGRAVGVVGFDLSPDEGGEVYVRSGHPLLYQADLFANYIAEPPGALDGDEGPGAWLGIFTQPLTTNLARYWGLPDEGGVVVSTIVPGSPAAASDLRRGDIIVAFNGTPVRARTDRDVRRFTRIVRESAAGEPAPIVFLRDGERQETSVTLGERPTPARQAGTFEDEVFGLTVRNITTEDRIRLNLGQDVQGVLVTRVEPGSWANLAGMVPGAIVLNFGGAPVTNVEDFERAVTALAETKPGNIAVFSQIGPRTGFFRLNPRWDADDGE